MRFVARNAVECVSNSMIDEWISEGIGEGIGEGISDGIREGMGADCPVSGRPAARP
jgi:hypothetical protein